MGGSGDLNTPLQTCRHFLSPDTMMKCVLSIIPLFALMTTALADWQDAYPACNITTRPQLLTSDFGHFESPSSRENGGYPNNARCGWKIEVTPGMRVALWFLEFSLEEHANCIHDVVNIFDGPDASSPLLAQFCGLEIPGHQVFSSGSVVYIQFKSDWSVYYGGFQAVYDAVIVV